MSQEPAPSINVNSWLEEELHQQYLNDRRSVEGEWKEVFETNGNGSSPPAVTAVAITPSVVQKAAPAAPAPQVGPSEQLVPLRGAAMRIAENMNLSLSVPTATSQRVMPVKVIDENRRILNDYRAITGKSKLSYTHLIGWAIVKAIESNPAINNAYAEQSGASYRIVRAEINLGLAVDVAGKDGSRSLMVPNIKNAGAMTFAAFLKAYDDLVARARNNKLMPDDFARTSVSLTNPGTVGTVGSVPRLMPGQGAIIATGAIDYPAEYRGASPETLAALGLSKIMTVTCTYDHRVIQGAESGVFLGRLQDLLNGADGFYDAIFQSLNVPYRPVIWQTESRSALPGIAARSSEAPKEASVLQLINAYRVRGHLIADVNPLDAGVGYHAELDPATYGLSMWDYDREFALGDIGKLTGDGAVHDAATLREVLEALQRAYCGHVGVEYMHIQHPEQKRWLQDRLESKTARAPLAKEDRHRILERIIEAESFEQFLGTRFVGQKRFSMEGAETAMAILDEVCETAANTGVHEIVMGMAHRGRLTILANLIGKTLSQIFSEFEGNIDPESTQGSGDVKYHLGASGVRTSTRGKEVVISVAPNPSHLEAVDPVVEGIVRPKQDRLGDKARERVIPVLIHGDAALPGQGVVFETMNLSELAGYTTGGTIHLVINNQLGFTTNPRDARSSAYCTDLAHAFQSPIFHVNGDDPEAAFRVTQIAFAFRQRFKKDVVIDMICYRKHGHNEGDDPSYTQPIYYRKLNDHPSVATQYASRLIREKFVGAEDVEQVRKRVIARYEEGFTQAKQNSEKFEVVEVSPLSPEAVAKFSVHTAADKAMLERVIDGITTFPPDFNLHPKLRKFIDKRKDVATGTPMDWAMAESLAYGTLVLEGTPVRLAGQDSGRGTFSQRHLEYFDYESGELYVPMQHLSRDQAKFEVVDSSLSEYAVMGFEFGYSVSDPLSLVLWEAQFGDFVNGAQIVIDQFVSSAESKWGQPSGLVLLLPHGYEGQGPEHSSARIERFLQLCAENNMQVCNCTTPAQYFHLLRRQMHGGADRRGMRKPLIIFTPKSILRHAKAVSTIEDLSSGSFREVLGDTGSKGWDQVSRIVFCSGKLYYDLAAARDERQAYGVALIRVEQLYPFPGDAIRDVLMRYPATAEVVWAQEEPFNMGPWHHIEHRIWSVLEGKRTIRYIGRSSAASPSAGALKRHQQEQAEIIEEVFSPEVIVRPLRRRYIKRRKQA